MIFASGGLAGRTEDRRMKIVGQVFSLGEDFMGVAEERGMGEMPKVADPGFGWSGRLLQKGRGQGGQTPREIRKTVVL